MSYLYELEKNTTLNALSQILADTGQDNHQNHATGTFLAKRW
jgi:hypothetical protein